MPDITVEIADGLAEMAAKYGLCVWDEDAGSYVATELGDRVIAEYVDLRLRHINLLDGWDDGDS